jgi:hypothetical protein
MQNEPAPRVAGVNYGDLRKITAASAEMETGLELLDFGVIPDPRPGSRGVHR